MKHSARTLISAGALVVATAALVPLGVAPAISGAAPPLRASCGIPGSGPWQTTSSSPCAVTAVAGTTVALTLSSHFRWSTPTDSSAAVTMGWTRLAPGGMSGSLHAVQPGTAQLRAVGIMICPVGKACPALSMIWLMNVTVTASTGNTVTVTVTQSANASTTTMREGNQLAVDMTGPNLAWWGVPTATNSSVLDRISGSAGQAIYVAVGTGTSDVSVRNRPSCDPKCHRPTRVIVIHVVITH